jgi:hypothetical protein
MHLSFIFIADHATDWPAILGEVLIASVGQQGYDKRIMQAAGQQVAPSPVTLNMDLYQDRLTLLDLLASAYPVPAGFLDPMQGDRIQTQWQLTSGRGANPWWNRINFTLTVWRMQALQSRGEFAYVTLQGTFQVPLPENVRQDVFSYYDAVRAIRVIDEAAEAKLQTLFWTAHEDTVVAATQAAVDQVPSLPAGEYDFALGWGKVMVKILAGADFFTDSHFVGPLNADLLPQRICTAADIDPLLPSTLPDAQRATVLMIAGLFRASDLSPIYTPLLEDCADVLKDGIKARLDLDQDFHDLAGRLRGLAKDFPEI